MQKREPIAELTAADDTPAGLAARLRLVDEARDFSIAELGLPDNASYRSYADLGRDYVVWNVFAAPEFSLEPKRWCYPVAGCVAYRGYFSEAAARREAAELAADGLDVFVAGVPAYSTLGRFSDPVLNTMLRRDDIDLVATLFHELAHQVVYVKGATAFNESFATFVEQVGVERWIESRGRSSELVDYAERREFRVQLMARVAAARDDLAVLYSSSLAPHEMRREKAVRFERLARELVAEFEASGRQAPPWRKAGMNNARLASMSLYESRLPEFRELFGQCDEDFDCFYAAARQLSETRF